MHHVDLEPTTSASTHLQGKEVLDKLELIGISFNFIWFGWGYVCVCVCVCVRACVFPTFLLMILDNICLSCPKIIL